MPRRLRQQEGLQRPGIIGHTERPEYGRAIDIVTSSAIKSMLLPALIPILFPLVVGLPAINLMPFGGRVGGSFLRKPLSPA